VNPAQVYLTTIYNRDRPGEGISFFTVPQRAINVVAPPPDAFAFADGLGFQRLQRIEPVGAWGLPFLVDTMLGSAPDFPFIVEPPPSPPLPRGVGRTPTPFAQYVTYAPVVCFEQSPVSGKSLAELVTTASGVSGAVGFLQTDNWLLLLIVPGGIIICGAARGISEALRIGLRTRLLRWMGVDDPEA
jgi:hypothetical protein